MEFSAVNTAWVLIAAALVFFMQAGFCILESGMTRAKNAGNIIMKNLMDFCIGTPLYWLVGFGIMFGTSSAVFGGIDFFARGDYSSILPDGVPFYAYFIFQTVFCATAATIVSGAMAERTDFKAYCIYSAIISLVVYPVSGHWIWGGGWLAEMGFHDFAGSCAVHMVGGCAALIGAAVLGPRIGKYDKNGKPRAILGHNLTMAALGVFILWFCWFGFNGGSTVAMEGTTTAADGSDLFMGALTGMVFSTTNMAAAIATITSMLFTWIRYKKPDVSMSLNGTLAGLVMVTASTDCIDMYGAAIEGVIAGLAVVLVIEFIDKVCKVDDPVGAVGVHFANGLLGTLCVGLFSTGQNGVGKGLFYGGGFKQLGIQALGVIVVCAWVAVTMFIVFEVLKHTIGLRVPAEIEIKGLDYAEHGLASAYSGFEFAANDLMISSDDEIEVFGSEKMETAVPAVVKSSAATGNKITKVEIIAKQSKLEKLKRAMNDVGVMGMTVTQVLGCGVQKGAPEYYRGVEVDVQLLPKIQVEMVISKVPVADVIEAARKALYTGHIGDGKIFVYDVEDVIKVRTGETGYDALQGTDD
jgi:Amt family ammonium transporter